MTDDQAVSVQDIFPVTAVFAINLPCDFGKFLLLSRHRLSLKNPIVTAAEALLLVPCKVRILCGFHIVNSHLSGDALDCRLDLILWQGDICLYDDVADAMPQKDFNCDAGICGLGIRDVHDSSGNAVAELVRM